MRIRRLLILAVVTVIALPLSIALVALAWIAVLDRTNGTLLSSGAHREYLLYVPVSYDPARPTPLVISLHAGATWPAHQKNLSGWNRLADKHGFIVAYPAGSPQFLGVVRIWRTTPARVMEDVQFVSDLIDTVEAQYAIDPARIYADGMSNGGAMAFAVSCALSQRIAAVAMVAAAQQLPFEWCADARPMPVTMFHGTDDRIAPYLGGQLGDSFNPVKPVYPPVREWVVDWAERNRCAMNPAETQLAPDVVRIEYADCADGATVVLHDIVGGGHSWPGGKAPPEWRVGKTSMSVDATGEIWAFFRDHTLDKL